MLKGILLACGAFGAFLPLHLAIFHLRAPHRRFGSMVRLHVSPALGLVAAYAVTPPDVSVIPAGWAGAGWLIDVAKGPLVHAFLRRRLASCGLTAGGPGAGEFLADPGGHP